VVMRRRSSSCSRAVTSPLAAIPERPGDVRAARSAAMIMTTRGSEVRPVRGRPSVA
jgi:hypothetical protein